MEIQGHNPSKLPTAKGLGTTRTTRETTQVRHPLAPPQVRPPEESVAETRSKEAAREAVQRARAEVGERADFEPRSADTLAAAALQGDAIDISTRSRQLMAEMLDRLRADEASRERLAERIDALKFAFASGELATDGRVSLAAERMLEGE